ncbi:hypothetical protein B0H17DRAFT_1200028 [Mycena rosella]|uniref:Uncharacterized protein n=1 Tax=Mycena rosella TaxID=1033263 RepID=A0AAD7DMR6_MYCRO|nr:hypothetical protein B0H17DRAFT_1200028 [Mycena rosella]
MASSTENVDWEERQELVPGGVKHMVNHLHGTGRFRPMGRKQGKVKGKKAAPKKQVTDKESALPPQGRKRKADTQPIPEDDSVEQAERRHTKRIRRSPEEAKLEREQRITTTVKPRAKPSYEYVEKSPVKCLKKRYIFRFERLIFGTQVPP